MSEPGICQGIHGSVFTNFNNRKTTNARATRRPTGLKITFAKLDFFHIWQFSFVRKMYVSVFSFTYEIIKYRSQTESVCQQPAQSSHFVYTIASSTEPCARHRVFVYERRYSFTYILFLYHTHTHTSTRSRRNASDYNTYLYIIVVHVFGIEQGVFFFYL